IRILALLQVVNFDLLISMENSTPDILSEKLLLAVKMDQPTFPFIQKLRELPFSELTSNLEKDDQKKAFWINIYNAFFQILRKIERLDKPEIFRKKAIEISGHFFSLDDIEHGILRKYRWKFSLGYLPNIFAPKLIKGLAVSKIDYRIHFALNCGAKSCPPIAFYSANKLNQQLNMATQSFLEGETDVFPSKKEVHVSRLFQWFRADFGGPTGIRRILKTQIQLETSGLKIVYKPYSWEEVLDNYAG
ncbi:MAG: DUF547 domain-containing protein, partial [Saprospiraceae bacterium]|nr:DUF547 domain-containing protein [Saprospiraceae bacterium]